MVLNKNNDWRVKYHCKCGKNGIIFLDYKPVEPFSLEEEDYPHCHICGNKICQNCAKEIYSNKICPNCYPQAYQEYQRYLKDKKVPKDQTSEYLKIKKKIQDFKNLFFGCIVLIGCAILSGVIFFGTMDMINPGLNSLYFEYGYWLILAIIISIIGAPLVYFVQQREEKKELKAHPIEKKDQVKTLVKITKEKEDRTENKVEQIFNQDLNHEIPFTGEEKLESISLTQIHEIFMLFKEKKMPEHEIVDETTNIVSRQLKIYGEIKIYPDIFKIIKTEFESFVKNH